MTPTEHEKREWARMAQAAYQSGRNAVGHRYSAAAALRQDATISTELFDRLMDGYRRWLVDGVPTDAAPNTRDQHCTHPQQAWCDCDWCRLNGHWQARRA